MIYTIENDSIRVQISDVGAELQSIVGKKDNTEYLWQGDAQYWSGRAYNLFPICGRLTDGKYTYQGKTYEMNLHGFARKSEFAVKEQTLDSITFRLKANETTLAQYPFRFDLLITYTIKGASLKTTITVKNDDTQSMIFAVGGHPGFNVPMNEDVPFTDYYLEFDCEKPAKAIVMSPTCYTTRDTEDFPLEGGTTLPLRHNLFDNDAIVLQDMCKAVTLKSRTGKKYIRVEYPDMNYLGLWHAPKTEAPYLCIEPWTSVPAYDSEVDDLETKRDMLRLEAGETYKNSYTIAIEG